MFYHISGSKRQLIANCRRQTCEPVGQKSRQGSNNPVVTPDECATSPSASLSGTRCTRRTTRVHHAIVRSSQSGLYALECTNNHIDLLEYTCTRVRTRVPVPGRSRVYGVPASVHLLLLLQYHCTVSIVGSITKLCSRTPRALHISTLETCTRLDELSVRACCQRGTLPLSVH